MTVCIVTVDVGDWLKLFGYDYNSIIPPVSYSGLVGTDDAAPGVQPVTSAFRCAYDGHVTRFSHLSAVSASLVTVAEPSVDTATVASSPYVFGPGVLLVAGDEERVTVNALETAGESLTTLATTLLNDSTVVRPRLVGSHGRDVLHFVRDDCDDIVDEVRRLQQRRDVVARLNVTVHRVPYESSARYVDVRLRAAHATINVRCGTTVASERARVRHRAWQRAVDAAWVVEREMVRRGLLTANSWTKSEVEQLVDTGLVDGYTGVYLRDVDKLIDCPRNIRFIPVT